MSISPKEKLVDGVFGNDPIMDLLEMSLGMQAAMFEVVKEQRRDLRVAGSRGCRGCGCREKPRKGAVGEAGHAAR